MLSKRLLKLCDKLRDFAIDIKNNSSDDSCYYHAAGVISGNRFVPGSIRTNETRSVFTTFDGFTSYLPSVHAEMMCLQPRLLPA